MNLIGIPRTPTEMNAGIKELHEASHRPETSLELGTTLRRAVTRLDAERASQPMQEKTSGQHRVITMQSERYDTCMVLMRGMVDGNRPRRSEVSNSLRLMTWEEAKVLR